MLFSGFSEPVLHGVTYPNYYGPWTTAYDRFRRWSQEGVWTTVRNQLQAQGRQQERIDFEFGAIDGSVSRAHKAAAGAQKMDDGQPLSHDESLDK